MPDGFIISNGMLEKYTGSALDIVIPEGVRAIGASVFADKPICSVTFPESLLSVCSYAFYGCSSLEKVIFPRKLRYIGKSAFMYCENLKSVKLPAQCRKIGIGAFRFTGITELEIPSLVEELGASAFEGCLSLEKAVFCGDDTSLEDSTGAFRDCSHLKKVLLPKKLTVLGGYCFSGCVRLESIELPEGLLEIKENAFERCSRLSEIDIPASVKAIGDYVIGKCYTCRFILHSVPKSVALTAFPLESPIFAPKTPPAAFAACHISYDDCAHLGIQAAIGYVLALRDKEPVKEEIARQYEEYISKYPMLLVRILEDIREAYPMLTVVIRFLIQRELLDESSIGNLLDICEDDDAETRALLISYRRKMFPKAFSEKEFLL